MKQSKFLKVMGIIMTIFGSISILINLAALIMLPSENELNLMDTPYTKMYILLIFALVLSIILIILGIMGIKNHNKPEKAKICITAGIIYIILLTISNVLTIFATNRPLASLIVPSIISYIVPTLYLVAAFQLKKMND